MVIDWGQPRQYIVELKKFVIAYEHTLEHQGYYQIKGLQFDIM